MKSRLHGEHGTFYSEELGVARKNERLSFCAYEREDSQLPFFEPIHRQNLLVIQLWISSRSRKRVAAAKNLLRFDQKDWAGHRSRPL
jgi:hypothetical protein